MKELLYHHFCEPHRCGLHSLPISTWASSPLWTRSGSFTFTVVNEVWHRCVRAFGKSPLGFSSLWTSLLWTSSANFTVGSTFVDELFDQHLCEPYYCGLHLLPRSIQASNSLWTALATSPSPWSMSSGFAADELLENRLGGVDHCGCGVVDKF